MMLLAAQTTLILGIIEAVVAVPQQLSPQPFTTSGQHNTFGGEDIQGDVIFRDESNFNKKNLVAIRNNVFSAQQSQWGWTREAGACIIANNDMIFEIPLTLNDCKFQCQAQSGCRSVEFNTQNGRCIISKATSRHPSYRPNCPIPDGTWIFTELVEIAPQITVQTGDRNQPSSNQAPKPDKFGQIGLSPSSQNVGSQTNPAHAVQQNRPVNTNPQQPQTVQQPGFPSSQNGRPQNPQNGANQGNAESSVPQHFVTNTQHAAHNGNQQGGQTTRPTTHPSSQGGNPQHPQSGFNPSNAAPSSSQSSGTANGSPVSGPPGTSGATSGSSQQKAQQCFRIPSPGECRGAFPRFFYNKTLDQCDCFLYGGCGNEALESSWLTNAECNDICHPGNVEEGPRCKLLPKQDIQTFTQASIIKPLDTSSITDTELLDKLSNSNNKGQQNNGNRNSNQELSASNNNGQQNTRFINSNQG